MEKNVIKEVKSLMERMEDLPGGYTGLIKEGLDEATCKWRDVTGPEEFYNILKGVSDGKMVTFGYVNAAKIVIPQVKRINPETNRMKNFDDFDTLGKNLGVEKKFNGVIKLSIYNFPWQTEEKVKNQYDAFKTKRDELAQKYGVEVGKARYGTENIDYGNKGGISSYNGDNAELTGHTYTNLNTNGIMPISTKYYLVMEDGGLQEISEEKLEKIPHKPSETIVDRLIAAGATEEEVEPLKTMNYQRFEHSHMLFFSATPDTGIPTVYINFKLSNKIGGITMASTDAIVQLAKDRYSKFIDKDF